MLDKLIDPLNLGVMKFLIFTMLSDNDTYGSEDIIPCIDKYTPEDRARFGLVFEF